MVDENNDRRVTEIHKGVLIYMCPGCKVYHSIFVNDAETNEEKWNWNRSHDYPTIRPNIKIIGHFHTYNGPTKQLCHHVITDGKIMFYPDSEHLLSDQTVDLPFLYKGNIFDETENDE